MLKTAKLNCGKYSNRLQVEYEEQFAAKFKLVENAPNFAELECFAQKCIDFHCGDSVDGISARVYMDEIIAMSDEEFVAWATAFGKK